MSTDYSIRDTSKGKHLKDLNTKIEKIHQQCLDMISALQVDPSIEEIKDSFVQRVQSAGIFRPFDLSDEADIEICSVTTNNVHWRVDNGFFGISEVEKKLNSNPDLIIVAEYGVPCAIETFKNIVDIRKNHVCF